MKRFINKRTNGPLYKVDYENQKFDQVDYHSLIDYAYTIDEDGVFEVQDREGNVIESFEVKKNDIVLRMYSNNGNYEDKVYIRLSNDQFTKYFEDYNEYREKLKKESEERKLKSCNSTDCECKCACEPAN